MPHVLGDRALLDLRSHIGETPEEARLRATAAVVSASQRDSDGSCVRRSMHTVLLLDTDDVVKDTTADGKQRHRLVG